MITEGGYCPKLQAACNTSEIMASPFGSYSSQRYCGTRAPSESLTTEDIHGGDFGAPYLCRHVNEVEVYIKFLQKMTNLLSNSETDKSFYLRPLKIL